MKKSFRNYLTESQTEYTFRIKLAGKLPEMDQLENSLEKFSLKSITKAKKTPIQEHPMDFQTLTNSEVYILDIVLDYVTTPEQLREYLCSMLGIPQSHMVVINKDHPEEIAREEMIGEKEKAYKSILDSEELEDDKTKAEYGDEYNLSFLKELETLKFEFAVDPSEGEGTTNDLPQGTTSPISKTPEKPKV